MTKPTRRKTTQDAEVALALVGERLPARDWLEGKLRLVLKLLKVKMGVWTINVARDGEMSKLHESSMGISGTTDVLTFDLRERQLKGGEGQAVELDTIICIDEAGRRAHEFGHSIREELLLYCVHSLLHVQGYDDVTAVKARAMHAREDELLVAAGVGAVYAGKMSSQSSKVNMRSVGNREIRGGKA